MRLPSQHPAIGTMIRVLKIFFPMLCHLPQTPPGLTISRSVRSPPRLTAQDVTSSFVAEGSNRHPAPASRLRRSALPWAGKLQPFGLKRIVHHESEGLPFTSPGLRPGIAARGPSDDKGDTVGYLRSAERRGRETRVRRLGETPLHRAEHAEC